jgi:hypothetical protein
VKELRVEVQLMEHVSSGSKLTRTNAFEQIVSRFSRARPGIYPVLTLEEPVREFWRSTITVIHEDASN